MSSIIEPRDLVEERKQNIDDRFVRLGRSLVKAGTEVQPFPLIGRVRKVVGTLVHAVVPKVEIGEIAELYTRSTGRRLKAEVVGFHDDEALLSPIGELYGVGPDTEVRPTGHVQTVAVGEDLLGRVIDGMGNFIDGSDREFTPVAHYPVNQAPPDPMQRRIINKPMPMGVRAIDGMLTTGEGQRMGIFASAGGGKSTLLAMLVKGADVDVTVLALIGERGREVREFIEHDLGPDGMAKSVVVVATSDKSSLERSKAAFVATSIAEYFRDQGKRVLLLMDSVTRFARAQREIGLAVGEPPTRRGFPPSVFATLPRLMERAGMNDKGSITAFYTVLMEGDDMNEPVSDETRSILDGHIVLSRKLAAANHYPAIDILNSKSRVMPAVTTPEHREMAGKVNSLLAKYDEVELLVQIGEYQKGADAEADLAIAKNKPIKEFLKQRTDEFNGFDEALGKLKSMLA
ncbi:type III secretion system ATPase SctN [Pseudovibrio sp. Tun.PSC04-5.I4]|uniref:type III secretion system ATPase SctN n=1 Tax=Pseudovibrio sp. Tun.PSC04-5.I4 TaxID=1798213 RepID=UPI00088D90D3|nr:type III secretion system ATPase SctN [Pseudovibrio sp. Tun.PSC04-5.I4]SDR14726.1 type III secretion system ATPase, FliI/YscN [Pseudovibrio sp. Tun.PSC04-5.I4]